MSEKIKISGKNRDKNKNVNFLRKNGFIPAVIYGKGLETKNIVVNEKEFIKIFSNAESQVIDFDIDGKNIPVLIQETQIDPLSKRFLHIDFYQVSKNREVHTDISLEFKGESPAVKDLGGLLVINLRSLSVKALPDKLVHHIEVNLDNLLKIGSEIKIKDIKLPDGIFTDLDKEQSVVSIIEPRKQDAEIENVVDETVVEESKENEKEKDSKDREKIDNNK